MKRIGSLEHKYIIEVLNTQFKSSAGSKMTNRLEKTFAKKFNVKYAVSFVNGTATIHAALIAAGVGPGDEVIVPSLTMSSTCLAVLHANAVPVFADVNPDTFTIDPLDIRKKITPYTKAIIPVSLYGLPSDIDPIMEIAKKFNLVVVEDDAQCFLGRYKNRIAGSIAHMASFSFETSKHITSGEGGMIITNDGQLADKVRRFGSLGYAGVGAKKSKFSKNDVQDPEYNRHVSLGFNYRMSELCSAVALAQVERLDELVKRRIEIAGLYNDAISGIKWLKPQKVPPGYKHAYWTYALQLTNDKKIDWHDFRRKYIELGGDSVYAAWKINYLEPFFQNKSFYQKGCPISCSRYKGKAQTYKSGLCPVAESIQPRLFQFKTNYMDMRAARRGAKALARTAACFK